MTLITAKKTVNSLYDYLHIKGLYLVAKLKPSDDILSREENIEFIVDFLDSTELKGISFWNKLERDVKIAAARFITLRDESEMNLISSSKCKDACIYILLSGKASVMTMSKELSRQQPKKLKHGSVFGPINTFNDEKDDPERNTTYKATVFTGSVLQLKLADLFRAKYGDQAISEDPHEGLTEEEITVRKVSYFGQHRLSPAMYEFLKRNNLLASSENDIAYRYIKHGSIGRSVSVKRKDNDLLIVLDGSLRVIVGHNLCTDVKCVQSGQKSAAFKIQQFPLSLIENGAILHLDEKILSSGGQTRVGGGDLDTFDDMSMTASVDPPTLSSGSVSTAGVDYLQHLSICFDKPTTYLSIPLKRLKNALQNETHRVNLDIRDEVNTVGYALASRLEKLKSIVGGEYVFQGAQQNATSKTEDTDASQDMMCNGDIASAESCLAGTYGIYSKLECVLEPSK